MNPAPPACGCTVLEPLAHKALYATSDWKIGYCLLHSQARALRTALRNLIDAEDQFTHDSAVALVDGVSERVEEGRALLLELKDEP